MPPTSAGELAGLDRIRRRAMAPTTRSSTIVSLAGSAPERSWIASWLALSTVKLPLIWPEPPRIGSRIDGRRDHLVVEHDGERAADVVLGEVAELARARLVEAEGDDRLVGALVEARLRVDELVAAHHRRLAAARGAALLALARRIDLVARAAGASASPPPPIIVGCTSWKVSFAVLPISSLSCVGVLQARHLHEDAVAALAHDLSARWCPWRRRGGRTVSMAALMALDDAVLQAGSVGRQT